MIVRMHWHLKSVRVNTVKGQSSEGAKLETSLRKHKLLIQTCQQQALIHYSTTTALSLCTVESVVKNSSGFVC